jgi:tryptophan synthase alpha chain
LKLKKLVAYITTGFPTKDVMVDLALSLKDVGVDTLELGIPFSDPVADGPVIERANSLALQKGFKIEELFEISRRLGSEIDTMWMGYFNPFYRKGLNLFIDEAKKAGVSGFIIPDLPYEEAKIYKRDVEKAGLSLIDFIAPTHSKERVDKIAKDSKKFIYLVAYAGVTGREKSEDISELIKAVRDITSTPIYIGFGVNPKSAREKSKDVDGVIVGSAFMKILLDETLSYSERVKRVCQMAKEIKSIINE